MTAIACLRTTACAIASDLLRLLSASVALALGLCLPLRGADTGAGAIELSKDDHLAIIGNGLADRLQHDGWLETLIVAAHPTCDLEIRNLAFSGDEVVTRLRTETGGTREQWLHTVKATVVLAFFGFNESFAGPMGLPAFRKELHSFLHETRTTDYSGQGVPRLALLSPIAQEPGSDPDWPDAVANNGNLAAYTSAMEEVAKAEGVRFVDLFHASQKLYASVAKPLTINGVHLSEAGDKVLAPLMFTGIFAAPLPAPSAALEALRVAVVDKCETWHGRYRTVDSYNIWGQRSRIVYAQGTRQPSKKDEAASKDQPAGITNATVLQQELAQRDVMTADRDRRIWAIAQGRPPGTADDNLPPVTLVKTNLPGENPDGSHRFLGAEEAITHMKAAAGCSITLFASEEQFPELVKPVQLAFDTKGRLWVSCWKNYPERTPTSADGDKIIILEDTRGVGKADKCTTFIDGLNCPTGFQFFKDGILVMESPDLWYVRSTHGDGNADWKERVLMGIDAADSHHEANSMVLDPGGATYLSDGLFLRSQVETAAGPVRNSDAAIYRFEPLTNRFERYVAYNFHNPHGRVFDYWGTDFISDASVPAEYYGPAFSGHLDYPAKHPAMEKFWSRPSRPCSGTAILSSRHFPEAWNGSFLSLNVIGMQGIFRVKITDDGSGVAGQQQENLLTSDDPNFRPVAAAVAPDGSLYVLDWSNAIIGHAQHHLRDPNRDHSRGRIYRITYDGRPLLAPATIVGASIPALLELLKTPENDVRTRVKIELSTRDATQVITALDAWSATLERNDPAYQHHLLEALWVHQWLNKVDRTLLVRLLEAPEFHARAAATRVLCYWRDRIPDALSLLKARAGDEQPRVRLEAVRAASFFAGADLPAAFDVAYESLRHASDYYLRYVYQETVRQLHSLTKEPMLPKDPALLALVNDAASAARTLSAAVRSYGPTRKLGDADLKAYELGRAVFNRDGHCVTCHQADGLGLPNIYPPLANKEWVADDDARIITIVLKGLWGPAMVAGTRFDPARGVPPMTAFENLLNDKEIAGVLTYVRQSFGNDYAPIQADAVRSVRASEKAHTGFYVVDELMKAHPIPGWEGWSHPP